MTSQYDLAGRRTRVTHPSGFFTEHDYLLTDEMSRVEAGGTTLLATYGYDDLGRRTSLTRGSGVVTSYVYDEGPWLASMSHDPAGTGYDLTLGFAYNPAGQIVSNSRSDESYAYTGHANANVTDTRNGLNQIVTTGGAAVDHNSRGDIIELPTPGSPAGNSTEYTYSDEDRLVTAEVGVTLTYDPLGRLYQVSSPAGGVRRFAYDGASVIGEYDAAGTYVHRYVHGAAVDDLLVWDDRSLYPTLSRRYAHADERGSVIAWSDSTTDAVTHVNRYDEYGRPQDGAVAGRFGYTGQMWVPELGMYYYRARIYNPNLGRFMQPDPIGYGSGMNLYAYVWNDPVNLIDPSGLKSIREEFPKVVCVAGSICVTATRLPKQPQRQPPVMTLMPGGLGGLAGSATESSGISDAADRSGGEACAEAMFRVTGVGPDQANTDAPTAITQQPGNQIDPSAGGAAIKPQNFGVPSAGAGRGVLERIILIPHWDRAQAPPGAPAIPSGLPSAGPYHPIDVIGPASVRNAPGNHIDLYRYSNQDEAFASTRQIPVTAIIPRNNTGVTCPE